MTFRGWWFGLGLLLVTPLQASELSAFNDAVADAAQHWRSAAFYLRTGNPDVAGLELDEAASKWVGIRESFAEPPDAFADDAGYRLSLERVDELLDEASAAAAASDPEPGLSALEAVRIELAALRQRNNVRTFSDCVDEMNGAMERLWSFRHDLPDPLDRDEVNEFKRQAAITAYLYQRCHEAAPPVYADDPEFQRLFGGVLQSLPLLFDAVDDRDDDRLINILREVYSFDRLIYLNFG
jgi:hypothetical protein